MAATRADTLAAFERFVATYGTKYLKAVEKLTQERNSLLAFYDFPAEHWQHVRTTNPIESTFATVRIGPRGLGTACRGQRSWGWRSS